MLAYVLDAMGDNLTAVVGAHVPQVSFFSKQLQIKDEFADAIGKTYLSCPFAHVYFLSIFHV